MSASDISLIISIVLTLAGLLNFIVFVIPRQSREVLRPKDGLSQLRWILLLLAVSCASAVIPPLIYRAIRLIANTEPEFLRNVSTICSSLSFFCASMLFSFIITYRRKE